jgi:hypothetical protein
MAFFLGRSHILPASVGELLVGSRSDGQLSLAIDGRVQDPPLRRGTIVSWSHLSMPPNHISPGVKLEFSVPLPSQNGKNRLFYGVN